MKLTLSVASFIHSSKFVFMTSMLTGGLEGATAERRFARFWTLSADLCGAASLSGSMGAK